MTAVVRERLVWGGGHTPMAVWLQAVGATELLVKGGMPSLAQGEMRKALRVVEALGKDGVCRLAEFTNEVVRQLKASTLSLAGRANTTCMHHASERPPNGAPSCRSSRSASSTMPRRSRA